MDEYIPGFTQNPTLAKLALTKCNLERYIQAIGLGLAVTKMFFSAILTISF